MATYLRLAATWPGAPRTGAAVAELITWYDILGVTAGAAADTISYAYAQRMAQLRPDLVAGAPSPVVAAATRAREAVQVAWFVLSDPGRRNRYDQEIGLHRKRSHGFAHGPYQHGQDPYDALRAAGGLVDGDARYAFGALAGWIRCRCGTRRGAAQAREPGAG
jgi:DnaJ-class molecular chaperone